MPVTEANGIQICYETFGDPDEPTALLIMGLGSQMIWWPDGLCEMLAARGFHVVRYDNRDVGLSTHFHDAGMPDIGKAIQGEQAPPYTLDDMAADAVGLLDALGVPRAHLVGVSMGGMIAQLVAVNHPQRVLSLTSIMSAVGGEDTVPPTPEGLAAVLQERPTNREEAIEVTLRGRRAIGSTGFPFDEERTRDTAGRAFDRAFDPAGFARQLVAIWSAPSRLDRLARLEVPACVIHGTVDPLVPPENGRRTADAIGDAEHVEVNGMGHDLPEPVWPLIVDAVDRTAARASATA